MDQRHDRFASLIVRMIGAPSNVLVRGATYVYPRCSGCRARYRNGVEFPAASPTLGGPAAAPPFIETIVSACLAILRSPPSVPIIDGDDVHIGVDIGAWRSRRQAGMPDGPLPENGFGSAALVRGDRSSGRLQGVP